ncbi:hypothetical protein [Inhella crocodyli]|uniref:Glycosyltransferase n=1 Tax=Inhella crocodyli TaxID=2499851 RepID=A0A3S2UHY4_9BURK|nr:hypothetical protein [Inhella crocodyli]RVT88171.1 hypothetical protein EOD73_03980 [Inhella crocodyli]
MNRPTPALVSEAGARPLSRWVLWVLCLCYLLPGQWLRDAWRHADLTAYGYMASLARGDSAWLKPTLAGVGPEDGALLPYWLGAMAIRLFAFADPVLASRLPFVLALAGVLALVWYAAFHLARTESAQPAPFAFGGEADTVSYARAMADAAVLALLATLGLLQMGHEATGDVVQLLGVSLWTYALASAPYRGRRAQALMVLALAGLALSGAPMLAQLLGLGGLVVCQFSRFEGARRLRWGLLTGMLLGGALASMIGAWGWRLHSMSWPQVDSWTRQLAWFTWPTLPLAIWTLWRWRAFLGSRHVAVPLTQWLVCLGAALAMGGSDRALLLTLPALAVLAAFALPTLRRSWSGMVDWFSLFFFSVGALFIWAYYLALQTAWPPRLAANLQRLAPDLAVRFEPLMLLMALLATGAWVALVRWRSSRQRAALWRTLALPAGGVVLAWVLVMTLWLQPLNLGRSNTTLVQRLQAHIPATAQCVAAHGTPRSLWASLETQGAWTVKVSPEAALVCDWMVQVLPRDAAPQTPPGWSVAGAVERPTERDARYWVLAKRPVSALAAEKRQGRGG